MLDSLLGWVALCLGSFAFGYFARMLYTALKGKNDAR